MIKAIATYDCCVALPNFNDMELDRPIVLTEFPKSGGSWISSMIGEILGIPNRDIYVKPGFDLFDINRHPWYREASELDLPCQSIIKSHELPNSKLIEFDATYVHLVRDGRDVVVSKWFFDKKFCVENGIISSFDKKFDQYLPETAAAWSKYVDSWLGQSVITAQYEDFLVNPVKTLAAVLMQLTGNNFPVDVLESCVAKYSKKNFSASLNNVFSHNTFVRKGISGDWVNHFTDDDVSAFKLVANDTLVSLGYESSEDWGL